MSRSSARLQHRSLPLLLLQAREQLMSHFRPILNTHGITEQQWRIVRVLLDLRSLEPREIGELCRISSPSLAGVLARMEELGLVARRRLEHDQRRVRVSLTPRARALAARMAPQIDATYRRIETLIGVEFSERFQRMLDQLLAALEPLTPRPPGAAMGGERPLSRRAGARRRLAAEPIAARAER